MGEFNVTLHILEAIKLVLEKEVPDRNLEKTEEFENLLLKALQLRQKELKPEIFRKSPKKVEK